MWQKKKSRVCTSCFDSFSNASIVFTFLSGPVERLSELFVLVSLVVAGRAVEACVLGHLTFTQEGRLCARRADPQHAILQVKDTLEDTGNARLFYSFCSLLAEMWIRLDCTK